MGDNSGPDARLIFDELILALSELVSDGGGRITAGDNNVDVGAGVKSEISGNTLVAPAGDDLIG